MCFYCSFAINTDEFRNRVSFGETFFEKELIDNNIPVFSDSTSEYLETMEVQTIINLLKVLDNDLSTIKWDYGFLDTKTIYKVKKS
mgnify:CR=1 FL=1